MNSFHTELSGTAATELLEHVLPSQLHIFFYCLNAMANIIAITL